MQLKTRHPALLPHPGKGLRQMAAHPDGVHLDSEPPSGEALERQGPGWLFLCRPPCLSSTLSPAILCSRSSVLWALPLLFLAFLKGRSLAGRGAPGVGRDLPLPPDSAPCRRYPMCLHMTQLDATGNGDGR